MLRSLSIAVVLIVAMLSISPTTADAHPKLIKTDPAADAVTATSPKEVRLSFNEELVAKFSGVELTDQKGKKVEIGASALDPSDKKQLTAAVPNPLAEGVYKVNWHAVGSDTHRVQGSYSFTIKD
jgi:methionine-rich copper-binding protein CopC